jgi:hypothetical protein
MRALPLAALVLLAACVGSPPVPCTQCGSSCVDTMSDSKNCGSCGKVCGGGEQCSAGACKAACPINETSCNSECVDTLVDPRHCGGCGKACAMGEACINGSCAPSCGPPNSVCGGACVDVQTDPANCGGCGMACDAGVCSHGLCKLLCDAPLSNCPGGVCADLNGDPNHCGACGNACDAGFCAMGQCKLTCDAPLSACPGGVCADLRGDPNHCGTCGTVCNPQHTTGAGCVQGTCGYGTCAAGFFDCDGDPTNGCEVMGSCTRSMLISHTPDGGPSNGESSVPVISGDGKRVLFLSAATNLLPGTVGGLAHAYQWDLATQALTLVDALPDAGCPTQRTNQVSITPSGRYACINSNAALSPAAVASSSGNVYRRDLQLGVTQLGSAFPDGGALPVGTEVFDCQISADGRFVAFTTRLALDPRDNNGEHNVYVHDMTNGSNLLVSLGSNNMVGGSQGYGANAFSPRFSPDFSKVAWTSAAGYPSDNNSCFDTWFRDLDAGTTTKMSVSGACVTNAAGSGPVGIVGPRSTVFMNSTFADLPGDNDGVGDVYARDAMPLGSPFLYSDSQLFALPNASVGGYNVTSDGRYVLMGTSATNLAGHSGTGQFVYLKDTVTFAITQVNFPESTSASGGARSAWLSDNGRFVTWDSYDTLMTGDTNGQVDVFWRQLY